MSTLTEVTSDVRFEIVNSAVGFGYNVVAITRTARTTLVNRWNEPRQFTSRASARKAITRLNRKLNS